MNNLHMAARIFKAVILGAPASGKGTVSARISKHFNIVHVSSGDKLRENIQNHTPIGFEARQYTEVGRLVPDESMINFIIGEIKNVGDQSWLLDGFPRTLSQATALWDLETLNLVIHLIVPYKIIIERAKGRWVHTPSGRVYNSKFNAPKVPGKDDFTGEPLIQREDDKPDVVMKRLEQYDEMTIPVIDFYRDKRILKEFPGEEFDEIWGKISDELALFVSQKDQII